MSSCSDHRQEPYLQDRDESRCLACVYLWRTHKHSRFEYKDASISGAADVSTLALKKRLGLFYELCCWCCDFSHAGSDPSWPPAKPPPQQIYDCSIPLHIQMEKLIAPASAPLTGQPFIKIGVRKIRFMRMEHISIGYFNCGIAPVQGDSLLNGGYGGLAVCIKLLTWVSAFIRGLCNKNLWAV